MKEKYTGASRLTMEKGKCTGALLLTMERKAVSRQSDLLRCLSVSPSVVAALWGVCRINVEVGTVVLQLPLDFVQNLKNI